MRDFILGVAVLVLVVVVVVVIIVWFGFLPTHADATPSNFEKWIADVGLDASMDRHAPRLTNPVPATDDNLIDGLKLYTMNCALCHGTLDYKPSPVEHSMYPPPPQLILDPLDDPEWHIYYAIATGVRYSGMPAWKHVLSDQDLWKVTTFLSRIEKLPPGVQQFWKKSYGVSPESHPAAPGGHSD
jgi:thiosulfate dehydrogenase